MSNQIKPRECVEWFAQAMEERLRANDHKPGWTKDKPHDLLTRLFEEAEELRDAVWKHHIRENGHCPEWILDEAADVANFAMMIADVCGGLRRAAHYHSD